MPVGARPHSTLSNYSKYSRSSFCEDPPPLSRGEAYEDEWPVSEDYTGSENLRIRSVRPLEKVGKNWQLGLRSSTPSSSRPGTATASVTSSQRTPRGWNPITVTHKDLSFNMLRDMYEKGDEGPRAIRVPRVRLDPQRPRGCTPEVPYSARVGKNANTFRHFVDGKVHPDSARWSMSLRY